MTIRTEHGLDGLIFGIFGTRLKKHLKRKKKVKLRHAKSSNHTIIIHIDEEHPELTYSEFRTSTESCYHCKVFKLKGESGKNSSNIWALSEEKEKVNTLRLLKLDPKTKLFNFVGKLMSKNTYKATPYIKIPLKFVVDVSLTKCKTFK